MLRDQIWIRYTCGWRADLSNLLDEILGGDEDYGQSYQQAAKFRDAGLRLLITKLALHSYALEHDSKVTSLQQLVPDYLQQLPVDPYSEKGHPLIYHHKEDSTLLYSVGANGIDDGGHRVTQVEMRLGEQEKVGDFFLFGSDELPTAENTASEESK